MIFLERLLRPVLTLLLAPVVVAGFLGMLVITFLVGGCWAVWLELFEEQ